MAKIKFQLPDNSPQGKRRLVASSGGHTTQIGKIENKFANSSIVSIPITKNAQFAGSAANTVFTQPMFFSPMHTPQNWQTASKRREIYQWSFIDIPEKPCYITQNGDFSLVNIKDIVSMYIQNKDVDNKMYIQNGKGEKSKVDKVSKRYVKKKANKIKAMGTAEPLYVTEDHNCMVIKYEDIKCSKSHNSKKCICNIGSLTCDRNKCSEYKNKNYKISKIKAKEVKKKDHVLIPFNTDIKESLIKNIDQARFAGHLASDGSVGHKGKTVNIFMNSKEIDYVYPIANKVFNNYGSYPTLEKNKSSDLLTIRSSKREVYSFASSLVKGKSENKKFTEEVCLLDPKLQLHVLGAYIQSDGSYNKINKNVEITTYSKHLANQLLHMFYRCNILARVTKQPISKSKKTYYTKNTHRYMVEIPSSQCYKIKDYVPGKIKKNNFKKAKGNKRFFWKNYVVSPVTSNESFDYEGYVYDIREPETNTVTANGISIYQCRFYYSNEPKVAAGVDFYSNFSMNGFKLECKNKKILKYYEKKVKNLNLSQWLNYISHEYFLIGDVFPFLGIGCPVCHGQGFINTIEGPKLCNHPDGTFESIKVMNPDYIEVQDNVLAKEPVIALVPDEELKMIIQRRQPKQIYDSLPQKLVELVASGQPIPLSNKSISHIKYNSSPYGTYGESMLRRLFTILAYKTKLMTANWIIAERLILPIRVVKVGEEKRPATDSDLTSVTSQLAAVANDPNLTIVTHHAFSYDWIGAAGKIHNITPELENIGKEILDGLMLNQAILSGEMSSYNSAQVGIEILIRRLDNWRNTLSEWVEDHIFLPIAMMQGFIDEKESELSGETEYLYPKLKWNDLNLRDKSNFIQILMQAFDKQMISAQRVLEEMDIDYDTEVRRIREEQALVSQTGMFMGDQEGMGGTGGMGGPIAGLGGMAGPVGGGMPGAEMGGMPGGDMTGGMPGGGMGGVAANTNLPKVTKRGKKGQQQETQVAPPRMIKLTKLEQQMHQMLQSMKIPYKLFGQFSVSIPGNPQPFALDFAYPQIGIGVECLHPDTYVPTSLGSKKAKDINIGEYLIGRNGDLVEITRKYVNHSKGVLLNIKSLGIDKIKVTENHPFLVCKPKKTRVKRQEPKITRTREYYVPGKPLFINASEIKNGDYLVIPKERNISGSYKIKEKLNLEKYIGKANNAHQLPKEVELNKEFGWLMGIYAAEGSSSGKRNKVVEFSFHIDEIDFSDKVQYLLKKIFNLPSSVYINTKDNCRKIVCCCTTLGKFMLESFGHKAPNKKLPYWMFETNIECKESFMEAFCQGDGCIRKENGINRYISSSKKLLIDLQALSFSIGKFATMCQSRKAGKMVAIGNSDKIYSQKGLWEVDMNPNECKNKIYREDDDYFYIPVQKITEEKYDGKVINFETKGEGKNNHTYLVSNLVTHNCDGQIWHENQDAKQRDIMRDQKLANVGWRILRFKEDSISEHSDAIKDIIYKNIVEASKQMKKASETEETMLKFSSLTEFINNNKEDKLKIKITNLSGDIGELWEIGI